MITIGSQYCFENFFPCLNQNESSGNSLPSQNSCNIATLGHYQNEMHPSPEYVNAGAIKAPIWLANSFAETNELRK